MKTLLLHLIALCNIYGNVYISGSEDPTFTVQINDIVLVDNKPISDFLCMDMTDLAEEIEIEETDGIIKVKNFTIHIKCNPEQRTPTK